ncbi:putative ubiquitin carboxyl-terminal hydrolase 19 [Apostichopus japonicus]|uniref:ubiquitinyl hydrolase 1 n=1 Tax=Stichopus japonicus TaxID=307972 RepID=A0A2G8LEY8_STIJA|nr:putative ubiquitin carboxyl-terminal hydrolase 19 [Apostichopus japonicus]
MKYEDDSDPPSYEWDQDESSVMMKIHLPDHHDDKDVSVQISEKSCSVSYKGKKIWSVELYKKISPETKKIDIRQKEVYIHVEKESKNMEWTSLEATNGSQMKGDEANQSGKISSNQDEEKKEEKEEDEDEEEEEEEDEGRTLKECNIDHIKNDLFEKKAVKDSIRVEFLPEKLTVSFETKDLTSQIHENTDVNTRFTWSSSLKELINPEKFDSSTGSGDWIPLKEIQPNSKETGKSTGDKNTRQKGNHGAKGGAKSVNMAENRSQKPTCTVPPLAHRQQGTTKDSTIHPSLHPLGFTGLDNLGNTCFMNGVLQVLANTRELKDFMLEDNVSQEINYDNPLGTGGQLVTSFAVLMKLLWSGKYKSYAPSKFKTIIATKASQFMGFAQHDAQEFMDFLLDGLHEDLNRVKVKPYTQTFDSDGRPDEVIAEESWKRHKRRNDSFVSDIFQGQYKSKLVCPVCNKVSITFDPFMQLSVPLPRKKQHLPVFFWSKEVYKKPIRMKLLVTTDGDVSELKRAVSERTGVEPHCLRVFEVFKGRIHKYFKDGDHLSAIALNDIIFVCEILSEKLAGEKVYECTIFQRKTYPSSLPHCSYCRAETQGNNTLKRCTRCLKAAYCDQECQKKHWHTHKFSCKHSLEVVGMPFMMSLPASHATYARICQTLESIARYSTDMFQPPVSTSSGSHSPSSSPGKVKKTDEVGTDEEDSRMEEDISEGDDVDTELAAEMIIRDSPIRAVTRMNGKEERSEVRAGGRRMNHLGIRRLVVSLLVRSAHNERNEAFPASKLSLKGNSGKQ